ncbi:MAG: hypothetical protein R3A46_15000 [Thermomicrobiales bacterium]
MTEVRVLNAQTADTYRSTTLSGYFDDPTALVTALTDIARHRVSTDPQPGHPGPAGESEQPHHGSEPWGDDVDKDIAARRWLLVDLDPVRPSGISASNEEHQAALVRARMVREALAKVGWPGAGAGRLGQWRPPALPDRDAN